MELALTQPPFFGTLLMLVVSNLLLWEKAASIPACMVEDGGCWDPLEETVNSAIQKAENLRNLAHHLYVEFYQNQFSSRQFADLNSQLMRWDETVVKTGTYCHSTLARPQNKGINIEIEVYLQTLINFVGSWISPLLHLVIELSAMEGVPETILSKAKDLEENNRQLLDDLRWILTKVSPTAEMKEEFPSWGYLSFLKSSSKNHKFLAVFNLSNCLEDDTKFTLYHLRILKCLITGKDC
ncbi:prolactin family 8, subfamily A, member 3 precursor [Rattus norvegicus]|uniref:Prolactin family 8, subfamily A, member 3 n=1 Tax=Rattus norvegicus TaxID=10116 RepID=G3V863_RAT|nr:prolactin family 8, subfamily A, member 3 precursor [Rattus norvegicus]AAB51593.1 prolactin-like protein-C variant [Rattus norvegicus]|eukprot:NP_064464.1 prolactin family 8, subfamily a, member 3 precursor [Rattus norvegicus]